MYLLASGSGDAVIRWLPAPVAAHAVQRSESTLRDWVGRYGLPCRKIRVVRNGRRQLINAYPEWDLLLCDRERRASPGKR